MVSGDLARVAITAGTHGLLSRVVLKAGAPPPVGYGMLDHVVLKATVKNPVHGQLARVALIVPPGVSAGSDQFGLEPGVQFTLTGTDEADVGAVRTWTQTQGPAVTLTGTGKTRTGFAPASIDGLTLKFAYSADGVTPDSMTVGVLGTTEFSVIGGVPTPVLMFLGP